MEHAMMLRQRSEEIFIEDYHTYFRCSVKSARVHIPIDGVLFIIFYMFHSNVIALCGCTLSAFVVAFMATGYFRITAGTDIAMIPYP